MKNPNKESYNQIAQAYHDHRTSGVLWQEELKDFASKMPAGAEIVDLGCGHGAETAWLARNIAGSNLTGIDFSDEMIKLAKEEAPGNVEYLEDDISVYHHPRIADGVWARGSLHHLNEQELHKTLVEIGTYLRPSGLLCCINKCGKGEELKVADWYGSPVERYFNYFSEGLLEGLVEGSSLVILSEELYNDDIGIPYLVSYLHKAK